MGRRIEEAVPPDETGVETFRRFAYQAHVAFPYCLSCYFDGGVLSLAAEHFEDLMVEEATVLRFLQIKTRNPDRGWWKFSHLCQEGGALRSLLRTHRALETIDEEREIRYEVLLEGAAKKADFDGLRLGQGEPTARQVTMCSESMGLEPEEAQGLLARVTVRDGQPLRDLVEARNANIVMSAAGHLSGDAVRDIVQRTVELLKTAMLAEIDPDDWLTGLISPDTLLEEARNVFQSKRIDKEALRPILSLLEGGDSELLGAVADEGLLTATALERKLRAAKASPEIIRMAKEYRARAAMKLAGFRGASMLDSGAILDDLDTRLLDLAKTVAEEIGPGGNGSEVWGRLHERTHQNPAALDRRKTLDEDPILLLGEVCDISDRCLFRWRANA